MFDLEVKGKSDLATAGAVSVAGIGTVVIAVLFSLPLLFICLPLHFYLFYLHIATGVGKKTKEVEKASYYDHLTDQITDQDPSLVILEGKDNELLISAKPQPKVIEPVVQEKVQSENYGHNFPFVKDLSQRIPTPPKNCKFILETDLYTKQTYDEGRYRTRGTKTDINDCKLILYFVDKGKKEKLYEKNISRFTYYDSDNESIWYNGEYIAFADAIKGSKKQRDEAYEEAKSLSREFISSAKNRVALWDKINNPPKLESYVIE